MKLALVALILLCSSCVAVTAREVAIDALIAVDWAQTLQIADHPDQWYERNPLLGRHPSRDRVNLSIGGALVANTVIHRLVPEPYLGRYQICLLMAESAAVWGNYNIGIRVDF